MLQHNGPISGIATFENKYVATAGYDNQIILWDQKSKQALYRAFHDHLANHCVFSTDGKYLVSSSSDHTARVWSVPDLKLKSVLESHTDDVEMAIFHPSKPLIATACRDHKVRLFSMDGLLLHEFVGHQADVISIAWPSNPNQLISTSDDGTIRRWSLTTGEELERLGSGKIETDTIVVSTDGTLYSGNDRGEIQMTRNGMTSIIPAHDAGIKRLCFNEKANFLVSVGYDRKIRVWRVNQSVAPSSFITSELPSCVWPRSCDFIGSDQLVFGTFGSSYATFNLDHQTWDLSRVNDTCGKNAVANQDQLTYSVGDAGVAFRNNEVYASLGTLCNFLLPFGNHLLTGGQMGIVYEAHTQKKIYQHRSPLNCGAVFLKEGKMKAIIGTYTGEGLIFGINSNGNPILEAIISLHQNAVKGIAANDTLIFSVCATGAAATHRISNYEILMEDQTAHSKIANGCTSLSENRFASVSRDLQLRIFDQNGNKKYPTPHQRSIKSITSSRDGNWIATGSYNGEVGFFDVKQKRYTRVFRPTCSGISSICASESGFLASSYDGRIYSLALSEIAHA